MVFLLAASPVPAALTVDFTPHVHRALFMILPLVFLTSYGYSNLIRSLKHPIFLNILLIIVAVAELTYFWHNYSVHADSNQSILRNDGDKEMIRYVINNSASYDRIIFPVFERLPLYYLYFTNSYDKSLIGKFKTGLQPEKYGKVEFYNDWCPTLYFKSALLPQKTLLVDSAVCDSPGDYKKIITITRKDATNAYYLYTPQ